jgi:hypothetical protein
MTNAIKLLLQRQSSLLQLESLSLGTLKAALHQGNNCCLGVRPPLQRSWAIATLNKLYQIQRTAKCLQQKLIIIKKSIG